MKETMIDDSILCRLPEPARVHARALMCDYTTFRLGGPCHALIECTTSSLLVETAKVLNAIGMDFIVIGQGSNLLVSDQGLATTVLRYCAENKPDVTFAGDRVRVSGNTLLDDLARLTIEEGVGDLSFCSGIPGTVGGAIAGNAGAFGHQIGDVVESVKLMGMNGAVRSVAQDELQFEYRASVLKKTGGVVLDAWLNLKPSETETMRKERNRIMDLRRSKHPDWKTTPCAGSVFRNIEPTSAAERRQAAGWFLEQAGAKDFRVGGARLFEKHANIIVTEADATASDVFTLSERMIAAVQSRFGFELVREIKLLGEF